MPNGPLLPRHVNTYLDLIFQVRLDGTPLAKEGGVLATDVREVLRRLAGWVQRTVRETKDAADCDAVADAEK